MIQKISPMNWEEFKYPPYPLPIPTVEPPMERWTVKKALWALPLMHRKHD